jgi:hypothetical protein
LKEAQMARYQKKSMLVEATQWFKDHDHLQVDPYYHPSRSGDSLCIACGKQMKEHGLLIDRAYTAGTEVVCPGDWIVTPVWMVGASRSRQTSSLPTTPHRSKEPPWNPQECSRR